MADHANSTPVPTETKRATDRHAEPEAIAFRRWEAEARKAALAVEQVDEDHPEFEEHWSRKADFEVLITTTPATTREALLVKLRLGRADRHLDVDPAGAGLFTQIIDHLAAGDRRETGECYQDEPGFLHAVSVDTPFGT